MLADWARIHRWFRATMWLAVLVMLGALVCAHPGVSVGSIHHDPALAARGTVIH